MLAVIKNGEEQYISYILAISNNNRFMEDEIIVFDKTYSYLKKMPLYYAIKEKTSSARKLIMQASIISYEDEEFIKGKWSGYEFIINNKELMKRLLSDELVNINSVNGIEKYAINPIILEWFKINNDKDIKNLMYVSSKFNDATLEEVIEDSNNILELKLDTMDGYINIRFEGIIENQLYDKIGELLDTELIKNEDYYLWKINDGFGGWTDGIDYDISSKGAFIKCKNVSWKIEVNFQE